MEMIISISGMPGSGKSTVAALVAEKLGYKHINIGSIRRQCAKRKGMTLEEYNKLGEDDFSTDKETDEYQTKLAGEDKIVIDSRLAYRFLPESLKVYLHVDFDEGARRIWEDKSERNETCAKSFEEFKHKLAQRVQSDKKRYRKYYDIDCYDETQYDIVIDTTKIGPKSVAQRIVRYVRENCKKRMEK